MLVMSSEGHACHARKIGMDCQTLRSREAESKERRDAAPLTSPRTRGESYLPPRMRGWPGRGDTLEASSRA